jgi:carbon-monoxide dehydrogenase small subunit
VNSCLVPILQAAGSSIVTIEGLSQGEDLHVLQQAFVDCGGAQCGICTPGMILAASHLLSQNPDPTMEEIREGLAGNLCRCTGYSQIVEAVAKAARRRKTA